MCASTPLMKIGTGSNPSFSIILYFGASAGRHHGIEKRPEQCSSAIRHTRRENVEEGLPDNVHACTRGHKRSCAGAASPADRSIPSLGPLQSGHNTKGSSTYGTPQKKLNRWTTDQSRPHPASTLDKPKTRHPCSARHDRARARHKARKNKNPSPQTSKTTTQRPASPRLRTQRHTQMEL